ncbi:hypothetical protein ACFLSY_06785, partial [Bacteroidota bacterium]
KIGKRDGIKTDKIAKKGEKIGRRKHSGQEINYKKIKEKEYLHVNIFRKDPVQDQWEIWADICREPNLGQKLKIYSDDILATKLQRGNEFDIRIKKVFNHHITIYRTIKKRRKVKKQQIGTS